MATVRRSALLRAGVVIAAISAVVALASGALPVSLQCLADREQCNADEVVALVDQPVTDTATAATFPPPSTSQRTSNTTPLVKVARAAVTHDDLINATFAVLGDGPRVTAAKNSDTSPVRPTTRVVQTTTVPPPAPAPLTAPETTVADASPVQQAEPEVIAASDKFGPPRIGDQAVNARSGPASSNAKLFSLAANVPVTVLDSQSKWLEVDDGKGHRGWVYGEYVVGDVTPTAAPDTTTPSVSAYAEERKAAKTATVLGSGVSVRSGAGSSYEKLFALAGGEDVDITEEKRGWLHIVDSKGRSGWAYSSFFKRGG